MFFSCSEEFINFKKCYLNNDSEKSIHDLISISGDTLIGLKWNGGLIITKDAGKTWTDISDNIHLKNIVIDKQGILWGLNSWIGIHEESSSKILFSKDTGRHWCEIEFDVNQFFPIKFFSEPNEDLEVETYNHGIYKLTGNNPKIDWTFIDAIEYKGVGNISCLRYKISSSNILFKQNSNGLWDSLMSIPNISIPFKMLESNDTIFIAASGYGGYKPLFASVTKDSIIKEYNMGGVQALGIICDSKKRIWTFGDGGIFLFNNNELKKMY